MEIVNICCQDRVISSLITDRLKNEMGRALLGIDDGVAGGSHWIGQVRVCESETLYEHEPFLQIK